MDGSYLLVLQPKKREKYPPSGHTQEEKCSPRAPRGPRHAGETPEPATQLDPRKNSASPLFDRFDFLITLDFLSLIRYPGGGFRAFKPELRSNIM